MEVLSEEDEALVDLVRDPTVGVIGASVITGAPVGSRLIAIIDDLCARLTASPPPDPTAWEHDCEGTCDEDTPAAACPDRKPPDEPSRPDPTAGAMREALEEAVWVTAGLRCVRLFDRMKVVDELNARLRAALAHLPAPDPKEADEG